MYIAFLTSEFVTESNFAGGLAQYLGRVTTALAQRGHHVEVFVTGQANGKVDYNGVIVHRVRPRQLLLLKCVNRVLRLLHIRQLSQFHRALAISRGLNGALDQRSSHIQFDIVQAASWFASGFFAVLKPVAPVVIRLSSYESLLDSERSERSTIDKKLYCWLELATLRRAAAVYTPSMFLAGEIMKQTGVRVRVIEPPFYDTSCLRGQVKSGKLADWPKYLLNFGRVCRYKGSVLLAEAIEPLLMKVPGLHLAIAGPLSDDDIAAEQLLRLAKTYPDSVRYLGVLSQDELAVVIKKAWAVVLPSLMDNLPNSCIESIGQGKVVVGPAGVSYNELIEDGKSGILFKLADVHSLRRAIVQAWNLCETKRSQIGQAAKKRTAQMAPKITLEKLENLYEGLTSSAIGKNSVPKEAIIKYV